MCVEKGNGHGPLKNSYGCHSCRLCLTLITALAYLGKQFLPGSYNWSMGWGVSQRQTLVVAIM